jgi:hypothetical protein
MSDPIYSFLPWLRSGVANSITVADGDATVMVRAKLPLDVTLHGAKLDGGADDQNLHRDVSLYGPGDIIGIDKRAIVKVEPRDWITSFEPNYLPYVEFYDEDFPWRYTPAKADVARHRLRPWITLVVLEHNVEFGDGKDVTGKPLPFIELAGTADPAKVFPKPDELWAWAHVHANVDLSQNGDPAIAGVLDKLRATLSQNPDLAYSRVMCPRRLEPNVSYDAFLIPTFESGRLAGLGQPVPDTQVATESAWAKGQKQFPYYHRWFFQTGAFGDFEYLVRLLVPKPVDKRVGVRDIDVMHPGSALPPIATPAALGGVLKLGGALRVPFDTMSQADQDEVTKFDQWDQPFAHPFEEAIAALIDLADDYARAVPSDVNPDGDPDPVVTLPLYGRWPALVDRVLTAPDGTTRLPNAQNWIHRLNLDPRFRVAAGLGTEVVQTNDQKYMAAAWQQVGDVLAANARLRIAQLALSLTWAMHEAHLASLDAERQFLLTSPVHSRIMGSPTTVAALLRASVVPPAVTSGVFRRITRQGTALMKRLGLPPGTAARIVGGINDGRWRPAPPKVAPPGAIGMKDAVGAIQPQGEPTWLEQLLERYPWLRFLPIVIMLVIGLTALIFGSIAAMILLVLVAPLMLKLFDLLKKWSQNAQTQGSIREEQQTPASVATLPTVSNFVLTRPGMQFVPQAGPADSAEGARFKEGLRDVYTFTQVKFAQPARPRLDLPGLTRTVVSSLHPRLTIPRRMKQVIFLPPRIAGAMVPVETFSPAMAYPVFDVPMYKPLSDLSSELFLPNINLIPHNSLTLLESNQRFIESYMVGLNHEMARELLWNEYPTDQRGSYFRQFWDVSMMLPPDATAAQKEALRDIPELHKWSRFSALGTHNQREQGGTAALLVLVIRGELLKRYPTAVIYAQKARWQDSLGEDRLLVDLLPSEEASPPNSKVRLPLFEAKVDPDIYFIGFDLTALEAKGGKTLASDPGWFFVIKERPGEPRFGMDDVQGATMPRLINWNDLAWNDVGTLPGENLALDKTLAFDTWVEAIDHEDKPDPADAQAQWNPSTDAAELAYMLYRVPVMVAVHASRMLP